MKAAALAIALAACATSPPAGPLGDPHGEVDCGAWFAGRRCELACENKPRFDPSSRCAVVVDGADVTCDSYEFDWGGVGGCCFASAHDDTVRFYECPL